MVFESCPYSLLTARAAFEGLQQIKLHIDVEQLKCWGIIKYQDYGFTSTVHFISYSHDEILHADFEFKNGYMKIHDAILPSGSQINTKQRKQMLALIERYLFEQEEKQSKVA